nr:hypothetical protein [Mycobacterium ulcerans]
MSAGIFNTGTHNAGLLNSGLENIGFFNSGAYQGSGVVD